MNHRHTKNDQQDAGAFTSASLDKAKAWREEVAKVRSEMPPGTSLKVAMQEASRRRKEKNPAYKTRKERYVAKLNEKRKDKSAEYKPYGKKFKRPLTFDAGRRILLQYYRDRANKFKKSPLSAMRSDISRCSKKRVVPCVVGPDGKMIVTPECAKSWKFRPGKTMGRTGPGVYDMVGLDDLCKDRKPLRAQSKLYNMKFMQKNKKPRSNVYPTWFKKRYAELKAQGLTPAVIRDMLKKEWRDTHPKVKPIQKAGQPQDEEEFEEFEEEEDPFSDEFMKKRRQMADRERRGIPVVVKTASGMVSKRFLWKHEIDELLKNHPDCIKLDDKGTYHLFSHNRDKTHPCYNL